MGKQWKEFEAWCAAQFGLTRCWANSGEERDFPKDDELVETWIVGQCKNRKAYSLAQLVSECEHMAEYAEQLNEDDRYVDTPKLGVVMAKVKCGRGNQTTPIIAMTVETFHEILRRARRQEI